MPQPVLKIFYDGLDEGKILGTKCPICGTVEWPPLPTCNECGSLDMEWIEIKGEAIVEDFYAMTEHRTPEYFSAFVPLHFIVGRLSEGTPISGLLSGIHEEKEEDYRQRLPFKARAKLLQLNGFKTVAWEIIP